ncbi:hypothetical protein Glove_299g7 [Diversispora epigaea]|uniref:Uncharacterized protein n=1 Tax=Diversispora epigaea TaxID=1348612 RepID=A0A397I3J1_9GLOM|nr:hypothetical protein Glove_299g7 [Diversispora epigaea]
MAGCGYTISRDLVIDIAGFPWVRSRIVGYEDQIAALWICDIAKEKKYLVHYVGYSSFVPSRQNPIHNFDENVDLHFHGETILIHQLKDIERVKAIKEMYSEYEEGSPWVRVIRNSTAAGVNTKREISQGCWIYEKNQTLDQASLITYKNWFYEARGFKERNVSVDKIGITE